MINGGLFSSSTDEWATPPLERKIELVDKIVGFKEKTVGEFVPEHHAYFGTHVNANPNDCCNLRMP